MGEYRGRPYSIATATNGFGLVPRKLFLRAGKTHAK
jgi:hypothetical protein